LDKNTRFLIANNLTWGRSWQEAKQIFTKAKKVTGAEKDLNITTDGLLAYPHAIGSTFHRINDWKHNHSIKHNVGGIRGKINNNRVERYHGSFRARDKVMRAFKKYNRTKDYLKNFRLYYNFLRKHQALDGKTPAQASGINVPNNWKGLLRASLKNKVTL